MGRRIANSVCRGVASSEAEFSLPSSEPELRCAVEGLDGEASSEVEVAPRVREGSDGLHCRDRPWAECEVGLFESFPFL